MKRVLFIIVCLLPIIVFLNMPANTKQIILIVGDSLGYAYGIKPEDSWASLLQERLVDENYKYELVNFSIPGDETGKAMKRFSWALNEYNPAITIIELGANDGLHHLAIKDIKSNLLQMITLAKRKKSQVILLGMRLPLEYDPMYRKAFSSIYPDLAKQEHVILVPLLLKNVDNNSKLMQEDKLHPIKEAQGMLLETVWSALKKIL